MGCFGVSSRNISTFSPFLETCGLSSWSFIRLWFLSLFTM